MLRQVKILRETGQKTGHDCAGNRSKDRSRICGNPQKEVLPLYFDYYSSPNAKTFTINEFPEVSLVSLTLRLHNVFKSF